MDELSREDFERLKNEAEEKLRKMSRSDTLPFPSFVKIPEKNQSNTPPPNKSQSAEVSANDKHEKGRGSTFLQYLNISEMLKNSDALLLLALILLLSSEDADETLILALAYILL